MAFKCPDHKECNPEYAWSLHYNIIMGELFLALHVCMHIQSFFITLFFLVCMLWLNVYSQ